MRPKKPGRKRRRIARALVEYRLGERRPLARHPRPPGLSVAGLRQRFRRALEWWLEHSAPTVVPPGPLVLIADGVWFRFGKQIWTLYVMACKPVGTNRATFLDPVLCCGKECAHDWRVAVGTISPDVRARIHAFVSDGFRGAKGLSRAYAWLHQRCHFHLIAQLQGRRGWYKHLPSAPIREAIYGTIRQALVTRTDTRLAQLCAQLRVLAPQRGCPKRFRMFVHDFLRELDAFRAYRRHPHLTLPTTTNVIESMAKLLRDQVRSLSTPASLQRWATAFIRLRLSLVCNGHKDQPI